MSKSKIKPGSDRRLISLDEDYKVAYWSKKFHVSASELAEAVRSVGNSADRVRAHVRTRYAPCNPSGHHVFTYGAIRSR